MAESDFTKKLVKLIKDLDKLSQITQNTIKDARSIIPSEKPKDDEGKRTDKQE